MDVIVKNVLITGGTGFVGSHIMKVLLKRGYLVFALVRSRKKLARVLGVGFREKSLVPLEIKKPERLDVIDFRRIIEQSNITAVIHNAALAREHWRLPWRKYLEVNVLWTENLARGFIDANVDHRIFIFTSTVGVYGTIPLRVPADERTPYKPDGKYHTSKKLAEEKLVKLKHHYGFPLLIFRPTIMYGDGDYGFMYKIFSLSRKGVFPLSNENFRIHLLDVEKLAEVYTKFVNDRSLPEHFLYNVADEKPIEARKLLALIEEWIGGGHIEIPAHLFSMLQKMVAFNDQYSIKVKLISKSWFYDADRLREAGYAMQGNTVNRLRNYLKWYGNKTA